ncbi:ATPase family protein 2 homolog (Spermatogenesis-associated factor protein) (Spermatogenesis-associated protein 5) [Durusdinium trenchii]|uniref:ATPase family protein 2 homolog (Spermatogenesis-associated factor protein) (Spermatogenesis-associated protein 5) n=1 Tax=Durusdinium trenchii TaxID=1381693 RepID=A0ABP0QJY7_9DINO
MTKREWAALVGVGLATLLPWYVGWAFAAPLACLCVFLNVMSLLAGVMAPSPFAKTYGGVFSTAYLGAAFVVLVALFVTTRLAARKDPVTWLQDAQVAGVFLVLAITALVACISRLADTPVALFWAIVLCQVVIGSCTARLQDAAIKFSSAIDRSGSATSALFAGQAVAGVGSSLLVLVSSSGFEQGQELRFASWFLNSASLLLMLLVVFFVRTFRQRPDLASADYAEVELQGHRPPSSRADSEDTTSLEPSDGLRPRSFAVAVFATFWVSLSVFPGITVLIVPAHLSRLRFHPIVVLLYNVGDLLGRVIATRVAVPSRMLPRYAFCRTLLVLLLLLCNVQDSRLPSVFVHDAWPLAFSLALGLTNGHLGSLCMTLGCLCVNPTLMILALYEPSAEDRPLPSDWAESCTAAAVRDHDDAGLFEHDWQSCNSLGMSSSKKRSKALARALLHQLEDDAAQPVDASLVSAAAPQQRRGQQPGGHEAHGAETPGPTASTTPGARGSTFSPSSSSSSSSSKKKKKKKRSQRRQGQPQQQQQQRRQSRASLLDEERVGAGESAFDAAEEDEAQELQRRRQVVDDALSKLLQRGLCLRSENEPGADERQTFAPSWRLDGLLVAEQPAATKKSHVERNRVLCRVELLHKLGVGAGDHVRILHGAQDQVQLVATVWPRDSLQVDQVQLSKSLLGHLEPLLAGGIQTVAMEPLGEVQTGVCRHVEVALTGTGEWAEQAIRRSLGKGHLHLYIKQLLQGRIVGVGSALGVLLNGFFCQAVVRRLETVPSNAAFGVAPEDEFELLISDAGGTGEPLEPVLEKQQQASTLAARVGGLRGPIEQIKQVLGLALEHPCTDASAAMATPKGIRRPRGLLLHGPPGTGKTLIAKCVAAEFGAQVLVLNGAEVVSKYVGLAEAKVNKLFETARRNAPAVIFLDEVDALCPSRASLQQQGSTDSTHHRMVALLLQHMDRLHEADGDGRSLRIGVIAATNRPQVVDIALRRPGRFDREVEVGIPSDVDREEILQIHLDKVPHDLDRDDVVELAKSMHGFVGADIMALVRQAAWLALRRGVQHDMDGSPRVRARDLVHARATVKPSALREFAVQVPNVSWDDVGGQEDVKQQLKEAVEWPLKHPEAFARMGIRPPQGVLLYGPPGCSKTLLAKAIATEGGMNFIAVKGPELFNKWVGESEKAVAKVFHRARLAEPTVVFFDEIDALAGARGSEANQGAGGVADRVLSQLLTEMDGIDARKRVVVVAATNRPDIVDAALLRPGRLDRLVYVPPPDVAARCEILGIHTRKMPLHSDVDLTAVAAEACSDACSGTGHGQHSCAAQRF